ncbi:hypothetical protein ACFV97_23225 [Streptomyces sp. NPDC059913]|uniref:hypothetical protein n=1 Tax=Streptomyces sp. NPDC059913 TaxID=3346999 RepID=UPI0036566AA5
MWKSAKGYGAGSKPSKGNCTPGAWVTWITPRGKERTGIVSDDPLTVAAVSRHIPMDKALRCTAVIIPADGGDMLPLLRRTAKQPHVQTKDGGRWRPVVPLKRTNPQEAAA